MTRLWIQNSNIKRKLLCNTFLAKLLSNILIRFVRKLCCSLFIFIKCFMFSDNKTTIKKIIYYLIFRWLFSYHLFSKFELKQNYKDTYKKKSIKKIFFSSESGFPKFDGPFLEATLWDHLHNLPQETKGFIHSCSFYKSQTKRLWMYTSRSLFRRCKYRDHAVSFYYYNQFILINTFCSRSLIWLNKCFWQL